MGDGVRQRNTGAESKKPDNSAFKQQRLPAWQPVLTAKSVLPMFVIVGLVFIPVGILIIVASNNVIEHEVHYTDCNAIKYWYNATDILTPDDPKKCTDIYDDWRKELPNGPSLNPPTCVCEKEINITVKMEKTVFTYYRLTDYYQNHRRYVKSRDDVQLLAGADDLTDDHSDCAPYDREKDTQKAIAPCGAIANSLFNDTFFLIKCDTDQSCAQIEDNDLLSPADITGRIMMTGLDIAWNTDKTRKFDPAKKTADRDQYDNGTFKNELYLSDTVKPLNWRTSVATLGTEQDELFYRYQSGTSGVGFQNEDFIVWMRTAAFPSFRKLYRKIADNDTGAMADLSVGTYKLLIYYNYPVHTFSGGKYFVLATTSWIGGKNLFLGYTYTIVGGLCFIVMFILFCISRRENNSD